MKKILFVHGYTASSKVNWYPNISRELDKMDVEHLIPDFPGGKDPRKQDWLELLDRSIKEVGGDNLILVGHSLGTRAIILYLDEKKEKIFDTVILIAPPANEVRDGEEWKVDFFEKELDLEKLQNRASKFIVVHSKDDSDCPYEGGVDIANELNAELVTFKDRDHMSDPENYTYILEVLKKTL